MPAASSSVSPSSAVSPAPSAVTGGFVDAFGGRYYRIANVDRLPPFFMNVVSSSDLWMFAASNGALSAGRINAEHALFPYQTVDRIYDSAGQIGPFTSLRIETDGGVTAWEPFAAHTPRLHAVERNLYKSLEGDRVWFEEKLPALGLVFRHGWASSEEHGWVRSAELLNLSARPVSLRLIDDLRNLHVPGVSTRLQAQFSCLADAYKAAETLSGSTLAVYALASGIVDQAVPMESLRATAVWSEGLEGADVLLSSTQLEAFHRGEPVAAEAGRRGLRGDYLLHAGRTLAAGETLAWTIVADTHLTQADVVARHLRLRAGGFAAAVRGEADASTRRLRALVGAADGIQLGGDEVATAHHFANVLFNLMRGGVFVAGHEVDGPDFADFVRTRNRAVAARHAAFLAGLPERCDHATLMARIAALGDADLERLGWELLPLTFSRRHGDPSRPWNKFNIRLRDAAGRRLLNHEGNWRDIFQNWEALCTSHPAFIESVVARFLNASTADGFNPYRITRAGIEWEKPEPEDPWASIGYWGDHQVVYLLRLLELSARFHPGRLAAWLRRDLFAYADVPYRICGYEAMRADPRATIVFDRHHDEAVEARVRALGTDGRLLPAPDGGVLHVNLTEKLLVLVLTRLTHFIPGGGIWMNTQRPEWNDANNALVGFGVSVVTTGHLRRLLAFARSELLPGLGAAPVPVSAAVADLLTDVVTALRTHAGALAEPWISARGRRAVVEDLAAAGSVCRGKLYTGGPGGRVDVAPDEIAELFERALVAVDATLRANRRADGLFHSYNLLGFTEPGALEIQHLAPMLEGQVSILGAGLLSPAEAEALLAAMRRSPLYRADQHSYLLYPDRALPGFVARNVIPLDRVAANPLLAALAGAGDTRLVVRDAAGDHRFQSELVNSTPLEARLRELAGEPRWADLVRAHADEVRGTYEAVFNHRAFTGRSGGMFGFEGLGCIYWHMVSKLLLSAQENLLLAQAAGDPAAPALAARYFDIRNGLGPAKTPAVFGAFPTDPYSHTPGHAGAQQPGMTGQVKEEILTRLGELGVTIGEGGLSFRPVALPETEFTTKPGVFAGFGADGREFSFPLPAGALAFTVCGTPVVYTRGAAPSLRIHSADGGVRHKVGLRLDAATSLAVFKRDGSVARLEVTLAFPASDSLSPFSPTPARHDAAPAFSAAVC